MFLLQVCLYNSWNFELCTIYVIHACNVIYYMPRVDSLYIRDNRQPIPICVRYYHTRGGYSIHYGHWRRRRDIRKRCFRTTTPTRYLSDIRSVSIIANSCNSYTNTCRYHTVYSQALILYTAESTTSVLD